MHSLLFLLLPCSLAMAAPSKRMSRQEADFVDRSDSTDMSPPSKRMSRESAARLDRALVHLRDLQRQLDEAKKRAQELAKPYEDEATEICSGHQIDERDLMTGRVRVDFSTGEITRPSPSPTPGRKP